MADMKLQVALDELERLCDTVTEFKKRNGSMPSPDSDAGRARSALEYFAREFDKLQIGKVLNHKI